MTTGVLLWRCIFGPVLYRIFVPTKGEFQPYEPNGLEYWTNCALDLTHYTLAVSKYLSPMICAWAYGKGMMNVYEIALRYAPPLTIFYVMMWIGRGVGRLHNERYLNFLALFEQASRGSNQERQSLRPLLLLYHYDFTYHPVDYEWAEEVQGEKLKPRHMAVVVEKGSGNEKTGNQLVAFGKHLLCTGVAHTFGIRLLYPGLISLIQKNLRSTLDDGRYHLMTDFRAKRLKLKTKSANFVDAIFVDRRNCSGFPNGDVLVVTCEGNAGYYEIGCPKSPLAAGYSVLGWNHPGFGGSTGIPWPKEESEAIDVVLQFALSRGFQEEKIVIYAWSIGGFVASWAGVHYPNLKAIILDAPFDDLLPLALKTLPESCSDLVEYTVRNFMNLHTTNLITNYIGPLKIIRRTRDEILSSPDDYLGANRCNFLIKSVLAARYPALFDETADSFVTNWLQLTDANSTEHLSDQEVAQCREALASYALKYGPQFPMNIGETEEPVVKRRLVAYLLQHLVTNFDAMHCTELPASLFQVPRHPWEVE